MTKISHSGFFPYITGTDKRYRSQCQKSMIFPNFETKNSQLTCEKKETNDIEISFVQIYRKSRAGNQV